MTYTPKQLIALTKINQILTNNGLKPLQEAEIRDWNITGDESDNELNLLAHDLISEEHTNKCENNFWKDHDWQQD